MYAHDSNVAALIEFDGGLRVNYQSTWQGSWAAPGFEWRTDCADGIITQRDEFGALYYARRDEAALTGRCRCRRMNAGSAKRRRFSPPSSNMLSTAPRFSAAAAIT